MNKYRVAIDFSGALDYVINATDIESAKHQAMMRWLEEIEMYDSVTEILTARPCMVENLTTGEIEYDEDV
jgi:hypothetical protein